MTKTLIELEKHLETVPPKFRPLASRALRGVSGKAAAVKAKCQECVNYEEVRERVGNCTAWTCPLWRFRPYQKTRGRVQDATSVSTAAPGEGLGE